MKKVDETKSASAGHALMANLQMLAGAVIGLMEDRRLAVDEAVEALGWPAEAVDVLRCEVEVQLARAEVARQLDELVAHHGVTAPVELPELVWLEFVVSTSTLELFRAAMAVLPEHIRLECEGDAS